MASLIFIARSNLRNAIVGGLLTFGLVACGGGSGSAGSAAAATSPPSLVSPSAGFIDRSGSTTPVADNTSQPPSSSPPVTTTPPVTNPPPVASAGAATLDWTPPTQNSDGTALSDLAGYTVYYGTAPGSLTQSVKVANPGLASYTVSNLAAGTWYFAVTAYSSSGNESTRSAVVSVQI